MALREVAPEYRASISNRIEGPIARYPKFVLVEMANVQADLKVDDKNMKSMPSELGKDRSIRLLAVAIAKAVLVAKTRDYLQRVKAACSFWKVNNNDRVLIVCAVCTGTNDLVDDMSAMYRCVQI